jgi:hypothetical protein
MLDPCYPGQALRIRSEPVLIIMLIGPNVKFRKETRNMEFEFLNIYFYLLIAFEAFPNSLISFLVLLPYIARVAHRSAH